MRKTDGAKPLQGFWGEKPLVATILPPRYPMRGMYFKTASTDEQLDHCCAGVDFPFLYRKLTMGRDPAATDAPVEVVFSRAQKPFKSELPFEEVLDAGVLLTPLVVVELLPASSTVLEVHDPLPQNEWGPGVVMPIF